MLSSIGIAGGANGWWKRTRHLDKRQVQTEITRVLNRLEVLSEQPDSAVSRLNTLRSRRPGKPMLYTGFGALYAIGEANRAELRAAPDEIEKNEALRREFLLAL